MKIVGGKIIPGTNEVGAYVAAIYPGGVADKLHGELREGSSLPSVFLDNSKLHLDCVVVLVV